MPTVLVIDDNPAVATALEVLLSLDGIETIGATSPERGLQVLAQGTVDLVIQDMNFSADTTSGQEGMALFARIREHHPDLPVILLTAWTHLESAVELVKAGAADYLAKPWDDRKLLASVSNLLALAEARQELGRLRAGQRQRRDELAARFDLCGMIFADPATERAVNLACQVSRADVPVLVTGPNGAGKDRIAAIIQANSPVAGGPFVTVNCGALPAELIEAELFGADAGAYTGANRAREGKFESANGGTLFLDEIGTLPAAGQAKLLRVLETGRFARLGSNREREVRVRVISATNADLPAMIRDGSFREDLFYRLNTIEIRLPSLAERPDDILPLADHFLGPDHRFSDRARRALRRHPWPGNVRELKNTIRRGLLLAGDQVVDLDHLQLDDHGADGADGAGITSDAEPDASAIEAALARHGGVIARAAAALGLSRQALYRRMDKLGISRS